MGLKKHMRQRSALLYLVPLLVLAFLWVTDPDDGASVRIWVLRVLSAAVALALAHWARKAMFDYPEADVRTLFAVARLEPTGAGLALVAVAIFLFGVLMLFGGQVRAQDVRSYVPDRCLENLQLLRREQMRWWEDHPAPQLLPALVEHESCVTLRSARCCSGQAQLKSAREEGASILQITRAWRGDGSLRFDALQELRDRHPALAEWSWENVYRRTDLANRAVVLKMRDNFQFFRRLGMADEAALQFGDAGYNGGIAGVQNERRVCAQVSGCDPRRWFGHVELHCMKSHHALYSGRSACDINRQHVRDVVHVRAAKYLRLLT